MTLLQSQSWPGNVRELKNAVERAAILVDEGLVGPQQLNLSRPAPSRVVPAGAEEEIEGLTLTSWSLRSMEEHVIRRALVAFEGNRSQVARELGINRTTLYNKLRAYGID